ncbi:uncharacterized protein F4807DRAFT_381492 [Annulohypoxylon truncatum]|uniref:uncharacterized protein n=1 Tax=Annulohypoxylon truncatum TaxID=327061 RepID=UPI0020073712|nr:uncharacterized protein F4807DRAFT_381492 [Annulohypoxylon truncatum]KAI1211913.1 hypothetical protein F4807DRAFT_381492 [Annulohypoxylon truncatum]
MSSVGPVSVGLAVVVSLDVATRVCSYNGSRGRSRGRGRLGFGSIVVVVAGEIDERAGIGWRHLACLTTTTSLTTGSVVHTSARHASVTTATRRTRTVTLCSANALGDVVVRHHLRLCCSALISAAERRNVRVE